jgi:hypothetical protein
MAKISVGQRPSRKEDIIISQLLKVKANIDDIIRQLEEMP